MNEYVHVGTHPIDLEDGRWVSPGMRIELPERLSPLLRGYVEEGMLVAVDQEPIELPQQEDEVEPESGTTTVPEPQPGEPETNEMIEPRNAGKGGKK